LRCALAYGGDIRSPDNHPPFVVKAPTVVSAAALPPPAVNPIPVVCESSATPVNLQSPLEERANTWSAAFGFAGAFGFAMALAWRGADAGQWTFAVALALLFLSSTAYHGLVAERAKEFARTFDHVAIFILIAATYTPFALGPLRADGGTLLFAIEWLLALIGLGFVVYGGHDCKRVSNVLYIGMGWMGLLFVPAFFRNVAPIGIGLLLAGGVFYTVGVAFYTASRRRFFHFIWHLFVLAGAMCHAVAVWGYSD
jgi:hemolysin III